MDLDLLNNDKIFENERFKSLLDYLEAGLFDWHFRSIWGSCLKLGDVEWEEILYKSLKMSGYKPCDWKPNSSRVVIDMEEETTFFRISCKSGQFVYRKIAKNRHPVSLKITGSRSSSYKTHEKRKDFLSDNKSDWYFCLAADSKGFNKEMNEYNYRLCIFESKLIKPNDPSFIWNEPADGKDPDKIARNAKHKDNAEFRHNIGTSSTSYQLVSNIPFKYMAYTYRLVISKND